MAGRQGAADIIVQWMVDAVKGEYGMTRKLREGVYEVAIGHGPDGSIFESDKMGVKPNGYNSEDHFQIETARWMWNEPGWEKFRRSYLHPANEGDKNVVKANRDFSKGMIAGAADWIFLKPVFVIELKQPGKKLTDNQKKFKKMCELLGIPHYVCEYMEDFQRIVREQFAKVEM